MASTVAIFGETGHGKSTAISFLDPKETYIINADKKDLPFQGWSKKYSTENRNYYKTSSAVTIGSILKKISEHEDFKHIKNIVIDTLGGVMVDDEMRRMKDKGYDKWIDLASTVYKVVTDANDYRDDLIIFFNFHLEDVADDYGNHFYRVLTSGRKLQKIKLETKFPLVLMSRCEYGESGKNKYYFETQAHNSTCKTPRGMFKDFKIDNNLQLVRDAIIKYREG